MPSVDIGFLLNAGDVVVRSPLVAPNKPQRRGYNEEKKRVPIKRKDMLLMCISLLYRNNYITLRLLSGRNPVTYGSV